MSMTILWTASMKLSNETLTILKNFSTINSNIVVNSGSTIKTMSESKTIMSVATVKESFPDTFGVYDLNEFLGTMNMFDNSNLDFDSSMKFVKISQGNCSVKYFFSEVSNLTSPTRDIVMPPCEISFSFTSSDMNSIRKASSALGATDLIIDSTNEGKLILRVTDTSNPTSNSFEMEYPNENAVKAKCIFNITNFKFINDDYDVCISSKLISNFKAKNNPIEYWIALEKSSNFGE